MIKLIVGSIAFCCVLAPFTGVGEVVTNYFLVAELPGQERHNDSYVIPISDPDLLEHARRLVREGPDAGRTIVFADIAVGANGINRNYRAPGAPAWSWHVTRVLNFADVGAEIYDGNPTFVEQNLQEWMQNTDGRIGFWNYTVVEEFPLSAPRFDGITHTNSVLRLTISALNPPLVYRLEQSANVAEEEWDSVRTFQATDVEMELTQPVTESPVFYRVVVEPADGTAESAKVVATLREPVR